MIPFEKAYSEVAGLVHEFEANEDHYLSPKYQEAEVREDFLNKFWTSLGWDVRHVTQTNPREQEVKVEKNPDSSASSRRADYAFYLKPDYRSPVFFCEAKKPSRKLSDPEFYFQLVRYGRGASTPVGVLTDFEEFHIIDCRYEPHIEKSYPSAQIKAFHYKDYLDRDNFGFIYWLFSREAVEAGKLKEFAKGLPKQRGAGKAKLTAEEAKPVDEAFLTKLEEYRLTLAKAFKKADESLTAEDLTEATQKVIDRLVFIRFLEDKNIESDYIVDQIAGKTLSGGTDSQSVSQGATKDGLRVRPTGLSSWKSFLAWSKELDVKYNGVVFKPHDIDKPSFKAPDDKVFAELTTDISHRYSKYLLSYIPIEILGSIYERFLGNVVNATAKRAEIVPKPEVRKAGGVYYTPKYIVDYIVENTVGKILSGESEKAVSSGADSQSASQNAASSGTDSQSVKGARGKTDGLRVRPTGEANSLTPKEISKLRFADIACGSGSFLIAVYDRILHHVEQWYNGHPDEARKAGCTEIDKGIFALSLKQKQQILLDNIFGVDIDHQAVEVAQLSLFLKLLESESGATAGQLSFEKTKILPDLSKNIQCGNSLVEYDIEAPLSLYSGRGVGGEGLTPEEFEKIKPFDFKSSFKQVMDRGGFDAIVGNPPYIRIQTMIENSSHVVEYFKRKYKAASVGNYDVYVLFVEKSLSLLNNNGRFGYILPAKFTNSDYGISLRGLLTEGKHLNQFVNFGHNQVFTGATTYTCVLILTKYPSKKILLHKVKAITEFQNGIEGEIGEVSSESFTNKPWRFNSGISAQIFEKITNQNLPLGEYSDIFVGLQTSADDVYIMDFIQEKKDSLILKSKSLGENVEIEKGILHPLVSGTDVKRYSSLEKRQFILFPYAVKNETPKLFDFQEIENLYPKAGEFLRRNKTRLSSREKGKFNDKYWYRFGRSQNLGIQERVKLCVPRLVERLGGSIDKSGVFFLDNVDVGGLTLNQKGLLFSLEYLLAIINSKLMNWFFPQVSTPFRGGWYSANRQYLSLVPIKNLDLTNPADKQHHDALVSLVEQMLEAKKRLAAASRETERDQLTRKCEYLDNEIDKLVYELYGLSEEEIKVVEGIN